MTTGFFLLFIIFPLSVLILFIVPLILSVLFTQSSNSSTFLRLGCFVNSEYFLHFYMFELFLKIQASKIDSFTKN